MEQRPWSLVVVGLLHVLLPYVTLGLAVLESGPGVKQCWARFSAVVDGIFVVYFVLPILMALFLFLMKRWSFLAYLATLAVVTSSMAYFYYQNLNIFFQATHGVLLVLHLVCAGYVLLPAARVIYFNPRLRWWEAKARFKILLPGTVKPAVPSADSVALPVTVVNYSEGGVFLESKQALPLDHDLKIFFEVAGKECAFNGRVVHRIGQGDQEQYGVQFVFASFAEKRRARELSRGFAALGIEQRTPPQPLLVSFLSWARDL